MSNLEKVNESKSLDAHRTQRPQVPAMLTWLQDPARRQLCKDLHCKGASDLEFEHFLVVSANSGLDPFKRQIFLVPRWDSKLGRNVYTPQTSIDGFRLIAERTGKYIGQVGPFWCGSDGKWKDVWLEKGFPAAAKVGVLHADFKEPLWAVARFDAYAQTSKDGSPNIMWKKMSDVMIAKCAESLAIRKAFPDQTAGLYTQEEMSQADQPVAQETQKNPIKEIRDAKAEAEADPRMYQIPFGKYKDKLLGSVDQFELDSYCRFIEDKAKSEGRTITGQVAEFLEMAERVLAASDVTIKEEDELDLALSARLDDSWGEQ